MQASINKKAVNSLKIFLDKINYHLIMTLLLGESNYFVNPLCDYTTIKRETKKIDNNLARLICFFSLGEPIERDFLEECLGDEAIQHFKQLDILNYDDSNAWLNNYILTSYCNCYFLVSNVYYYPTNQNNEQKPYIGIDTYWLSRMVVNRTHGRVLDLCTGSGIQGILAAKTSTYVVGVDIDLKSVLIAQFNIVLNEVDDRMEVHQGDLYNAIDEAERFDFILANPPFIPIPNSIEFPISGDGGEDGMQLIKRIVCGYDKYLKFDGEGIMIGQAIGDSEHLLLEKELIYLLKHFSAQLIVNGKTIIENQANGFAILANRINSNTGELAQSEMWIEMYKRLGAEYFYNFTLNAKKTGQGYLNVMRVNDNWNKNDIPLNMLSDIEKTNEIFVAKSTLANTRVTIDDETLLFLHMADGTKTIQEIVSHFPFKLKVKYGQSMNEKLIMKYSALCSLLERQEIVKKANIGADIK